MKDRQKVFNMVMISIKILQPKRNNFYMIKMYEFFLFCHCNLKTERHYLGFTYKCGVQLHYDDCT